MRISYRTRRILQRMGLVLLGLLTLAILVWFCWVVWAERFIIYTSDGVVLDMEQTPDLSGGSVALPPEEDDSVSIYFNEGDNTVDTNKEQTQLKGYYITPDVLSTDIATARERLRKLPSGTAVMIDVKSAKGHFYYSSEVDGATLANIDIPAADDLISQVIHGDYYAIARVPAFRDYWFGFSNVPCGIHHKSGRYLWMDEIGCYWLNPTNTRVQNFIIDIVSELKAMGFDEVVLTDFRVPTSENIIFNSDREEALAAAMDTFMTSCAADGFSLSFALTNPSYPLPDGRSRLYLEGISASGVGATAAQAVITNPEVRLVFVAATNDTRYDQYGVLRPLEAADVLEEQRE